MKFERRRGIAAGRNRMPAGLQHALERLGVIFKILNKQRSHYTYFHPKAADNQSMYDECKMQLMDQNILHVYEIL